MVKHWLETHQEEETCPEFRFKIVGNFKDALSRQVAEAVMIHYSKDILLNSKNEYNTNCLARVKVDESRYEQKNRERMEALEEAKEKEAWAKFKDMKAGFRKRKDKDDTIKIPKAKKPRLEQAPNIEEMDLGDWLRKTEKVCQRAGELGKYLDMDKQRMLRRMQTFEEDQILTDIQPMWEEKLPCGWKESKEEDPIPDGGKPSGEGYPITTPHSWDPGEGGGDAELQPGEEEDVKSTEVVASTCRLELSKLHKHSSVPKKSARKTAKKDIPSLWWESLVGLVGWWRRVELENDKLEIKRRKLEDSRRKKEENKMAFLRKFYPNISATPGGSERLRTGDRNLTVLEHPTESKKIAEFSFSPHPKRKVGVGVGEGNLSTHIHLQRD